MKISLLQIYNIVRNNKGIYQINSSKINRYNRRIIWKNNYHPCRDVFGVKMKLKKKILKIHPACFFIDIYVHMFTMKFRRRVMKMIITV